MSTGKKRLIEIEEPLSMITKENEAHVDLLLPQLTHTFLNRKIQGHAITPDEADAILDNAITLANQVIARRSPDMK